MHPAYSSKYIIILSLFYTLSLIIAFFIFRVAYIDATHGTGYFSRQHQSRMEEKIVPAFSSTAKLQAVNILRDYYVNLIYLGALW